MKALIFARLRGIARARRKRQENRQLIAHLWNIGAIHHAHENHNPKYRLPL